MARYELISKRQGHHKAHAIEATNMVIEKPDTFITTVSAAKCPICPHKVDKGDY